MSAAGRASPAPSDAPAAARAREIARALLAWFDGRERDVPWRGARDPYRVWVAEVMAQQTRLDTVRPYYRAFLERFPDVGSLAAAPLDDVLKAWQGLGYYARARHLHAAARVIAARHGGSVPSRIEELRALPGVGPYTAGAIASLAFGRPEPAVDGNARRVLSRLSDLASPSPGRLERAARSLLAAAPGRAAALNQALMDLGGAVCTPSGPECPVCPARGACLARMRGTQQERPPRRSRAPLPHRRSAAAAVTRGERLLLVRRREDGLLGGLWDLPAVALEDERDGSDYQLRGDGHGQGAAEDAVRERLAEALAARLSISVAVGRHVRSVDHVFSHFRLRLDVFEAGWVEGEPTWRPGWTWATPREAQALATPTYLRSVWPRMGVGAPARPPIG